MIDHDCVRALDPEWPLVAAQAQMTPWPLVVVQAIQMYIVQWRLNTWIPAWP